MGDRTKLFKTYQRNQTWLKKIQPAQNPQQRWSKSHGRMTPDSSFEQDQISTVSEIVLFCEGMDAPIVINGRCIVTLCNVT